MKDPEHLKAGRVQLHYAIQYMAATNSALVPPQPDGSHVTLQWDPQIKGFVGKPIQGDQAVRVALEPVGLTSLILNEQLQPLATLPLNGLTMAAGLAWHQQELAKLGVKADQVTFLEYPNDFPDHLMAHGAVFEGVQGEERSSLVAYFSQTQPLLEDMARTQTGASAVHIWPHHFDMATLITLSGSGEKAKTIGIGLSPGDECYQQPYWYITPYPPTDKLPPLPSGHWHTEDWVGAVLKGAELGDPTLEASQGILKTFLDEAVKAGWMLLQ